MIKSLLCFFLISILFYSCSDKSLESNKPLPEGKKSFTLRGTIENFGKKEITLNGLDLEGQRWIPIDTVNTDEKGKYEIKVKEAIPDFYVLRLNDSTSQTIIADNEEMEFSVNLKDFEKSKEFKYTKANNALIQFSRKTAPSTTIMKALSQGVNRLMKENKYDSININQQVFEKERIKIKNQAKSFVDSIMPSLAVFAVIDQFNFEQDFTYLDSLLKRMNKEMPSSKYTKMLQGQFEKANTQKQNSMNSPVSSGKPAPDFEISQPNGQRLKLSSLQGKYVLVDFWASWCKPCRAENPNVVKMYEKYKSKNFEILSVSLDEDKDAWLKAIKADGLNWKHASDLKGWESIVVGTYGLQGIPATFLLDPKGIIIASNLRGGDLEDKLKEVLE